MQYEIKGAPFPALICHLDDGEQMITEGGGMSWMTLIWLWKPRQTAASAKQSADYLRKTKCFKTDTPVAAEKV